MKLMRRLRSYFRKSHGPMVVSQRRRDALTGAVEVVSYLAVPIGDAGRYRVTVRASGRDDRLETWSRARLMGL